jgi:hypothetical protein
MPCRKRNNASTRARDQNMNPTPRFTRSSSTTPGGTLWNW